MQIVAYHGTSKESAQNIYKRGFDLSLSGISSGNNGWYGQGIYFTDSQTIARQYAGTDGCIIKALLSVNRPLKDKALLYDIIVNSSSSKLIAETIISSGYDSVIVTINGSGRLYKNEIVIFNTNNIALI